MGSNLPYSAKAPTIINQTLILANTWYKVASAVKGVRKWMIKASESTYNAFDVDMTTQDTPLHATYLTNSGTGLSMDGCDMPDIYCRSDSAGTVIEILLWA
jgi:hypothetical protein